MISIEKIEDLEEKFYKLIGDEFNKFAIENEVRCNYTPFNFIAKENKQIIGLLTGHSYYKEIYIEDLIVLKKYRNRHIGSELIKKVEEYFKDKGFENMNLTTYNFQAPEFYKKCGFQLEFIRENKENSKLNKYFFVKYFKVSTNLINKNSIVGEITLK